MSGMDHMSKMENSRYAAAAGFAVIILFLTANLFHIRQLWGINLPGFYSDFIIYILCGFAVILAIPPITAKLMSGLARLHDLVNHNRALRIALYISFAVLFFALSLQFRSVTTFLGDGHLRTNQLTFGRWFLPTEFLDFLLHATLFNFVLQPLGYNSMQCYQIFSSICGLIFIIGLWRLSSKLFERSATAAFILLASSGVTAFFFGYIESYSLITCMAPFVILSGIKAVENKSGITAFIILCVVAYLIHSISIFIFMPAMIYVLLQKYFDSKIKLLNVNRFMIAATIITLIILYLVRMLFDSGLERYILPIIPNSDSPQALLTFRHLLNIVNWLCLAALPLPVIIALILKSKIRPDERQRCLIFFAVWIVIPSFLFILLFTPQLGGPRDWDLFAFAFFIILIAALIVLSVYSRRIIPVSILPVVIVSLILTGSMIGSNNSIAKSTDRFAEIIEVSQFNNLFKEYNLLNAYAKDHPEIRRRQLEFALKAWEQPPPKKSDSSLILNKLGEYYMTVNKPAEAEHYLNLSLAADPYNIFTYHYLTNFARSYGTQDDLLNLAAAMADRLPTSAKAQMDAGVLLIQLNQSEHGRACLEKAYMLDSNDVFVIVNYANLFMQDKNYPEAVRLLLRAVDINPDYFKANYNLALAYTGIRDRSSALQYLNRASALTSNQSERKQLENLKRTLGEN